MGEGARDVWKRLRGLAVTQRVGCCLENSALCLGAPGGISCQHVSFNLQGAALVSQPDSLGSDSESRPGVSVRTLRAPRSANPQYRFAELQRRGSAGGAGVSNRRLCKLWSALQGCFLQQQGSCLRLHCKCKGGRFSVDVVCLDVHSQGQILLHPARCFRILLSPNFLATSFFPRQTAPSRVHSVILHFPCTA